MEVEGKVSRQKQTKEGVQARQAGTGLRRNKSLG